MFNISKVVAGIVIIIVIAAVITGIWYGVSKKPLALKESIKIGFSAPLTGDAASWGLPVKRGAEIALDKINNEGGINGRKLELIFEDDKCDSKEAVTVASKLININKVPAIIGSVCSSVVLAMAPIVEQNKAVLLASAASAPVIKEAGDYVFTIYPLDDYEAGIAAEFAYDKLGERNAAILYANNDYGKGAKDVLEHKFQEKNGAVDILEPYLVGTKDFRAQLTKIKNSNSDVLFIWGQPNEMVPILMQIKELGIKLPIITTSVDIETDDLKKAGLEIAEGVIYTIFKTSSNANSEHLKNEHQKRFEKEPDGLTPFGYDVVLLIADALKNSGVDAARMKDYLYSVKNFPGASGNMSFDQYGTVIKDFEFKTVKNGQFVPFSPEN